MAQKIKLSKLSSVVKNLLYTKRWVSIDCYNFLIHLKKSLSCLSKNDIKKAEYYDFAYTSLNVNFSEVDGKLWNP